jgi:hypothetical protein
MMAPRFKGKPNFDFSQPCPLCGYKIQPNELMRLASHIVQCPALQPYFAKLNQNPDSISPRAFELLFLTWLTDIARSRLEQLESHPSLASLLESGLLSSLQQAEIEMNTER